MFSSLRRQRAQYEVSKRRGEASTYLEPLTNVPKDELKAFLMEFYKEIIYKGQNETRRILDEHANVKRQYQALVQSQPQQISHEDFWQRYYYRCDVDRVLSQLDRMDAERAEQRAEAVRKSMQDASSWLGKVKQDVVDTTTTVVETATAAAVTMIDPDDSASAAAVAAIPKEDEVRSVNPPPPPLKKEEPQSLGDSKKVEQTASTTVVEVDPAVLKLSTDEPRAKVAKVATAAAPQNKEEIQPTAESSSTSSRPPIETTTTTTPRSAQKAKKVAKELAWKKDASSSHFPSNESEIKEVVRADDDDDYAKGVKSSVSPNQPVPSKQQDMATPTSTAPATKSMASAAPQPTSTPVAPTSQPATTTASTTATSASPADKQIDLLLGWSTPSSSSSKTDKRSNSASTSKNDATNKKKDTSKTPTEKAGLFVGWSGSSSSSKSDKKTISASAPTTTTADSTTKKESDRKEPVAKTGGLFAGWTSKDSTGRTSKADKKKSTGSAVAAAPSAATTTAKTTTTMNPAKKNEQDRTKEPTPKTGGLLSGWRKTIKKSSPLKSLRKKPKSSTETTLTTTPVQASAEPTQENHPKAATKDDPLQKSILDRGVKEESALESSGDGTTSAASFGGWILVTIVGVLSIMVATCSSFGSIQNHLCGPMPLNRPLHSSDAAAAAAATTTHIITLAAPWWAPDAYKDVAFNTFCSSRSRTQLEWNGKDGKLTIFELGTKEDENGSKPRVLVSKKKLQSVLAHTTNSSNKDGMGSGSSHGASVTMTLTLTHRGGKTETIPAPW